MNTMTTAALVAHAVKLAPTAAMASSAELCASDAQRLLAAGNESYARARAQRSLDYSVGVFEAAKLAA